MKKLILLLFFIFASNSFAEVIFSDNFNGHTSGWTPSVDVSSALYPWTTDETYNPEDPTDDGGGINITTYEPSSYPVNERTNSNSWNGWVENRVSTGAISIQATGGVDNSPALRVRLVKYQGLSNETGLNKWLGNTYYQEIYVQYKVKFGTTPTDWWWGGEWSGGSSTGNGIIWKLGRVWTGFNPTDYDKTGGQSQPVENTTWTDESNWRTGIWIPGLISSNFSQIDDTLGFILSDFHWEPNCPAIVGGSCDSQNNPRGSDGYRDWIRWSDNLVPTDSLGVTRNFTGAQSATTGGLTGQQVWHTIEIRFKNRSTPSTEDGAYGLWINGVDVTADCVGMASNLVEASMSSNPNDYGINFIRLVDNFNELTQDIPDVPGYMDFFIDDFIVSTTYIGIGTTTSISATGTTSAIGATGTAVTISAD